MVITVRQIPPSEQDASLARASQQIILKQLNQDEPLRIQLLADDSEPIELELPTGAVTLLVDILSAMANGQGITLIPQDAMLSTTQAADILNVSRPFLVKLLEEGDMPYHKVGSHRRVRMQDVMQYKQKLDAEREALLDELVAEAQEHNMGYDK